MVTQLWEDLGNWHSSLRKKACVYVSQRYQWDPDNCWEENISIVKGLLGERRMFLRNGVDEDGRTNNLAHPALLGVIIDFFYPGTSSIGQLFPEVFCDKVLRVAVAVAAMALKVVLDEIVSSGEVTFRVATYTPIYLEMLGLMNKCDTSPIHVAKMKALRTEWARIGSNGMKEDEATAVATMDFDVELD
ncbi:hypothetical protein PISMIDRAFT_15759 [Pisolithus microcarpus 441]|uniref:DUF6532 domain-containing protein n=1 Tax=Pisolithus microcarpus 441 TaxID=765257 RepID=A0A0C9Z2G2_9AGAM|nr:hypothetical protein BKA83DRAFT_15759 [Pisolithus microcarpus]KIK16547.1 hypothetical protein PISMIDRAFT_15759 [Pisolithus microcarpus 441]